MFNPSAVAPQQDPQAMLARILGIQPGMGGQMQPPVVQGGMGVAGAPPIPQAGKPRDVNSPLGKILGMK